VSNTLPDVLLTMTQDAYTDTRMHACTDEQDKTIMPPATLCWAEAQNVDKCRYTENTTRQQQDIKPYQV